MSLHNISLELHSFQHFSQFSSAFCIASNIKDGGELICPLKSIQFSELGKTGLLFPRQCREGSHKLIPVLLVPYMLSHFLKITSL